MQFHPNPPRNLPAVQLGRPTTTSARSVSPWLGKSRAVMRDSREAALIESQRSKLRMFQAELRLREEMQIIKNADELMDYAVRLAGIDDGKLEVFTALVLRLVEGEAAIMRANHIDSLRYF